MTKKEKKAKGGPTVGVGLKPKHSLDVKRPNKGVAFQRDAATVGAAGVVWAFFPCAGGWGFVRMPCLPCNFGAVLQLLLLAARLQCGPSMLAQNPACCCLPQTQVRRLQMYKKRAVRDKKGRIIHEVSWEAVAGHACPHAHCLHCPPWPAACSP